MKERFISSEYELPLVHEQTLEPATQEFIASLWKKFALRGWELCNGGVKKRYTNSAVINPDIFITTDTGPTIEFSPSPSTSLHEIESQRKELMREILDVLQGTPYTLLGSGVHPKIIANPESYLRLRTPRKAYDYAINERGWHHHSILGIAATQEVIDIRIEDAIDVLRCCHRLTPYMTYLFRNDFDCYNQYHGALSIRPSCWKNHIPNDIAPRFANDQQRVWMPQTEITSWSDYLSIIWKNSPMFFIGTKHDGPVYIPRHPTFVEYLASGSQTAVRIQDLSEFVITPTIDHVEGTDWHYMGTARLRWKLDREKITVAQLNEVIKSGDGEKFNDYIQQGIAHIMIENRSSATALPSEEIVSLAFMVGLLSNLQKLKEFLFQKPYAYYVSLAHRSEHEPYNHEVLEELEHLTVIAYQGLYARERNESKLLRPITDFLQTRISSSEQTQLLLGDYSTIEYAYQRNLYKK